MNPTNQSSSNSGTETTKDAENHLANVKDRIESIRQSAPASVNDGSCGGVGGGWGN